MTVSAQLVSAALRYAESGFAVIPLHSITEGQCTCGRADCASPGKHPRTKSGLKDATTDANQIEQWWSRWPNANLGLSTDPVGGRRKPICISAIEYSDRTGLHMKFPATNYGTVYVQALFAGTNPGYAPGAFSNVLRL